MFYDPDARIYTATPAPVDSVEFTPLRFALLQSALRDIYELVATRPGRRGARADARGAARRGSNKLVLNGWDDRNRNPLVDWPDECVERASSGLPRGGLQMAERTLTGEIGSFQERSRRGRCATADVGSRQRLRARDRRRAAAGGARRLGHLPHREALTA